MEFRRARTEGATYFFIVVTEHRRPLLVENVERLRKAFRDVRAKRPFIIEAVVVLPDHLHSLWVRFAHPTSCSSSALVVT